MLYRCLLVTFFALTRLGAQNAVVTPPEPFARVLVGVEQTAAGASAPVQKLAAELSFSEPLHPRVEAWGDVRLSSLPRTVTSTAASLPLDAVKLAASTPLTDLVRSGDFLAGVSYRVSGQGTSWSTLSVIAGAGASTALASAQSRFLRQYYGGLRVESAKHTHIAAVMVGQNEVVTGGSLAGAVVRFDGFYSLPLPDGTAVYLFGTAILRAAPGHSTTDNGRDSYRIGLGVDVFQILKALRSN